MSRHVFTKEECSRGGITRSQMPDFPEHCENAYEILKWKRPDAALYILRQRVAPYMAAKAARRNGGQTR